MSFSKLYYIFWPLFLPNKESRTWSIFYAICIFLFIFVQPYQYEHFGQFKIENALSYCWKNYFLLILSIVSYSQVVVPFPVWKKDANYFIFILHWESLFVCTHKRARFNSIKYVISTKVVQSNFNLLKYIILYMSFIILI